jgi:lipoprotein-releasing system ATP-binding protein
LVLADEPTGNLDSDTAEQIYQLIRRLNETVKTSFIIVTHDLLLAKRMDRQVKLVKGQLQPLSMLESNNESLAESAQETSFHTITEPVTDNSQSETND